MESFFRRPVEVQPFYDNKALWWSKDEDEAESLKNCGRWFLGKQVTILMEKWTPDANKAKGAFTCKNSCIAIEGLPFHLWDQQVFQKIGGVCGGLLQIDKITSEMGNLSKAIIKVRGPENGFLQHYVNFEWGGNTIELKLNPTARNLHKQAEQRQNRYKNWVPRTVHTQENWSRSQGKRWTPVKRAGDNPAIRPAETADAAPAIRMAERTGEEKREEGPHACVLEMQAETAGATPTIRKAERAGEEKGEEGPHARILEM